MKTEKNINKNTSKNITMTIKTKSKKIAKPIMKTTRTKSKKRIDYIMKTIKIKYCKNKQFKLNVKVVVYLHIITKQDISKQRNIKSIYNKKKYKSIIL